MRPTILWRKVFASLLIVGGIVLIAGAVLPPAPDDFSSDPDQACPICQMEGGLAALPALPLILPGIHFLGIHESCLQGIMGPSSVLFSASLPRAPPIPAWFLV